MPKGTVGQIIDYKNGVRDGQYILDDEYTEYPAQLTAIRIEKLLEEHESPYQHIAIYDTSYHGRMMVLDGFIQITTADYFCYHEMIVHVPMSVVPHEPKRVLVVGGGDGAAVNEFGKYKSLEKIVWIDIDADVVRLCKKYMSELYTHHDERVEFIAMNGADIEYEDEFDVVIVDGTDFIDAGSDLASNKFYQAITKALKPNGLVTTLGWWAWPDPDYHRLTKQMARTHFQHAHYYWFIDPSMKYGHMGVVLMTNSNLDPTMPTHLNRVPLEQLQYYNGPLHSAAFVLPTCFQKEGGFVVGKD
ncbi:methyltransferase domain-containing protein [Anaerolineales bacterium HSG24]|nr:methyltransferase domain-containing protein [Anaerolineales bacterium HSG24]